MRAKYYPPVFNQEEFNCARCGVFASQVFAQAIAYPTSSGLKLEVWVSRCAHCKNLSYWYKERLIIPADIPVEAAHSDLPDDCKPDFEEARIVFAQSPRSAAALLRLCIEKLMPHLGEHGNSINDAIKSLVSKGLPVQVQQALDFCRVVGNHAVHPGELNLQDTPDVAQSLFGMVNFIVEDRIARPKEIQALYNGLPESSRTAIDRRDTPQS